MPFLIFVPVFLTLTEVLETVAVVGAVATTTYVGVRTVGTVIDAATRGSDTSFPTSSPSSTIRCEAKVGKPPVNEPGWERKWEPPRGWDGEKKKVPNDKSKKRGYPHKDGSVWVPDDHQHGGPGWEVQYPNGDHEHVGKDGKVRKH
ncbi:6964_t:CDS:1 [Ambispora leptoticha]|uniref:6964_t:CDS:1 n=1 Tax=Ambispora leptoticha TaxID=144679 RepID=A0A9N8YLR3_9GLOM|nr:6964_t:CDS:1 [Ambispora leptoticha]